MQINSNLLQKTRIIKGLTREGLSKKTGIAMATLAKIEAGIDPRLVRPKTLLKIVAALDLTMEQVILDSA